MADPQTTKQTPSAGTACSPSKVEEIIAALWTILWAILWANDAHPIALWFVGIKATLDHLCAITFAIREICRENSGLSGPKSADNPKSSQ